VVREFLSEVRLLGCFSRCICLSVSLQDLLFNGPYCKFHQRLVVFEGLTTILLKNFRRKDWEAVIRGGLLHLPLLLETKGLEYFRGTLCK
jgi:hypothetical protein